MTPWLVNSPAKPSGVTGDLRPFPLDLPSAQTCHGSRCIQISTSHSRSSPDWPIRATTQSGSLVRRASDTVQHVRRSVVELSDDDFYDRLTEGRQEVSRPPTGPFEPRRRGRRGVAGLTAIGVFGLGVGILAARATDDHSSTVIAAAPTVDVVPSTTTIATTTTIGATTTIVVPTASKTAATTTVALPPPTQRSSATTGAPSTVAPKVAAPTTTPPVRTTHTVSGTLLVDSYTNSWPGQVCGGTGRFSDFQVGQVVTVSDGTGTTVAQGALTSCSWSEEQFQFNVPGQPNFQRGKALFQFSVAQVPEVQSLTFRVSWKQWAPPHTLAEMKAANWMVDLGVR